MAENELNELKAQLLSALEAINPDSAVDPTEGICCQVNEWLEEKIDDEVRLTEMEDFAEEELFRLFRRWPEFSGRRLYPVPGFDGMNPDTAFNMAEPYEMWSASHPYGQSRRRLLEFCKDTLRAELAQATATQP